MPSFNSITIVGHLGRDPELRYTPQGKAVTDFTIATSEKKSAGEEVTTWFKVTVWGSQAENCERYLKKGSSAYVQGRLSNEEWLDRDGNKRTTLTVTATDIKFLGSKPTEVAVGQAAQLGNMAVAPDDDVPF